MAFPTRTVRLGELTSLCWPASRLDEAMEAMARRQGLTPNRIETLHPPESLSVQTPTVRWIEPIAERRGLQAQAVQAPYAETERFVRDAGPALLRLPDQGAPHFLALLAGDRRHASLLAPDFTVRKVPHGDICAALRATTESATAEVDKALDEAGFGGRTRRRARAAMLRQTWGPGHLSMGWLLRPRPGASLWRQALRRGLPQSIALLAGLHALQMWLFISAWWVLGWGALGGRLDRGWLMAWALLLLTAVPARLLVTWLQGRVGIDAGRLLKQRLLQGALRLESEEIRGQGSGQFLSRIIEAGNIESLALNGGLIGLIAGVELLMALVLLGLGEGGGFQQLLLAGWTVATLLIGWGQYLRRGRWSDTRLELTNDLTERMIGHRTRLAQEAPSKRHQGEDQSVDRYLADSRSMDRLGVLQAGAARGWLVLGLLGLAPGFVAGSGSSASLGIALGGVLLAFMAFRKLGDSLSSLLTAVIAWRQIAKLSQAAARGEGNLSPESVSAVRDRKPARGENVLEAHDLTFGYPASGRPVLQRIDLRVRSGEHLLLQGPSGCGKSTLASLLTGLRSPSSGLLLLGGLDLKTLGPEAWTKRVASAPQFHENHVLTGTFAFNLLMGRQWPPSEADLREAEELCRELGLGELLDRMPAGMMQMVGETGWQLSHGERSRLFMARALLQGADLVILDESFAALDPSTLERCLLTAKRRAPTLLVIAHP